ncbi:hypothetical protein GS507_14160 [Rhodococcus hoagii]|nr:hypothetical protein [Prescottella equi]
MFAVRESGGGLQPGDLLVPPHPTAPVVLVSEGHLGSSVASSFAVVRPVSIDTFWLWGVLNSQTGSAFRRLYSAVARVSGSASASLASLKVPLPVDAEVGRIRDALIQMESTTRGEEEEAVETWWRTVDLTSDLEWRIALATPSPELLQDGDPLGDLCAEVRQGRPIREEVMEDASDSLPFADVGFLGGNRARRWVPLSSRPIVARRGDILLAAAGIRAQAMVVTEDVAISQHVYVLKLRNPDHGAALVRYLNGQIGHARRQILLTGAAIPTLNKSDLARFPVPAQALAAYDLTHDLRPLSVRLEQLLWT